MAYEAPRITEVGRFSSVTLGQPFPVEFDDNSLWFFGSTPSPQGSR